MNAQFFRDWLEYFQWNAEEPDTLPWQAREALSDAEIAAVGKSLATFQLGEKSEGTALRCFASRFAERNGIGEVAEITVLFVKEEQHHAHLLARFMEKHGLPVKTVDWTDSVFRIIRKPFGFEAAVTVLITAEIIGAVYYRALREATESRLLKAICTKILEDEKSHLEYESALLISMQAARGGWSRAAWRLGHRLLFAATVIVVFKEHVQVLRRGGYSFVHFFDACWGEFHRLFPSTIAELAPALGQACPR